MFFCVTLQTQFLHCIDQFLGEGGENEFVDGFFIEKIIRQNHPEEHKILTQKKVDFVDVGSEDIAGEFSKMFQAPVFKYNNCIKPPFMTIKIILSCLNENITKIVPSFG